ncbi:MAG: 2-hydroxyacid dehydrogenase, partial [Planctomycetota bacterium]
TSHQAFFTREALDGIAATTIANLTALAAEGRVPVPNRIPGLGE